MQATKKEKTLSKRLVISTRAKDPFANMIFKNNKSPMLKPVYVKRKARMIKGCRSQDSLSIHECNSHRDILPPISPSYKSHLSEKQTKIPKYQPKFIEDSSSNSSTTEVNLIQSKPAKNVYKSRSKIPQKNKGKLFINNSEPESSSRPRELPKISDKFKLSPYVLKKDEAKKNAYSSKKNVKYGVMIRGLEKF